MLIRLATAKACRFTTVAIASDSMVGSAPVDLHRLLIEVDARAWV